jgi:oligoendopeptidase F
MATEDGGSRRREARPGALRALDAVAFGSSGGPMTENLPLPHWDLDPILPPVESEGFRTAFSGAVEAVAELRRVFDEYRIGEASSGPPSPEAFERVLGRYLAVRPQAHQIEAYLECLTAADTRDETAQARLSEFQPTVAALSLLQTRLTAWVGKADIESMAEASPLAKEHIHCLRRSVVARHLMGPAEEALAAEVLMTGSIAWERLHANVTSQIMVPFVIDGEERRLPISEVQNLAQHADRAVRQRAFVAETAGWESVRVPLAAALNSIKGEVNLLSRRRGWASPLEATLFNHAIDRPILDSMMTAAQESFPDFHRYLRLKARRLGLERMACGTWGAGGQQTRPWDYASTRRFIEDHFAGFSAAGRNGGSSLLRERIDAGRQKSRRLSAPGCGEESRILANFTPTLDGMASLAHELGHAYHNRARAGRTFIQRHTPPVLSETASIFCETLVSEAAYAAAEQEERLAIVESFLLVACAIVLDVIGRFYFEQDVFERRATRELSAEELCASMREAQRRTYGDGVDPTLSSYM